MNYLLDTNAFSDLMRRQPMLVSKLHSLSSADKVIICPIVRGEILYGLGRLPQGQKRADLQVKAFELLQAVPCEVAGPIVGDHYAAAKLHCERIGASMDDNDLWIAASALALGANVVTRDGAFARVPGLTVRDWTV